ncbi:MAG: alpha/beta hydrolase [Ktedonobacteraceae bacterium]|nr:alpha/beta hydrolase [Ktedonobacteraceae bacterium]MBO0796347.1 alpha/beta hydrolase [Ktedonobacteraceae bacterium]
MSLSTAFEHHTAQVGDVTIHYVRMGNGAPLVLLHGWPQTWFAWRHMIPLLAQHYTVIVPDLRGLGDSSKPVNGYDKRTIAEDVYQLTLQLGFEHILLVGHDWGGHIAYAYAAGHRDGVQRLAIVESLVRSGDTVRDAALGNDAWFATFHRIPNLPETLIRGRERVYLSWFYENLPAVKGAITEADIDEYVRTYSDPRALHAGFELYRALPTDLKNNAMSAQNPLRIPVLALGGDKSLGPKTGQALEVLATDVRGGIIKNCGHFVPEEYPDLLASQLLEFFAEEK